MGTSKSSGINGVLDCAFKSVEIIKNKDIKKQET
jgi:hypothetical protein